MISADEKTSIQARQRCHATLAPASARDMGVEYEYNRGGALAYLAAWDVHGPGSSAAARRPPVSSRSAASSNRWPPSPAGPAGVLGRRRWQQPPEPARRRPRAPSLPKARLVQLPVHASWLNQVEIYFSVVQRMALTPKDFVDPAEVETTGRIRAPLRADRRAVRTEVHPRQPHQAARSLADHPGYSAAA